MNTSASRLVLPDRLREAVQGCGYRFVVVGAGGWIGLTLLVLLAEALADDFYHRVACFGSGERPIELPSGRTIMQDPLSELPALDNQPTMLFHLAFLTKDKVAGMAEADYVAGNARISDSVRRSLDRIGVERLFVASSGAAAFADDPAASHDLRLYGRLKREDEDRFADWAVSSPARRRAAICRIYSVSGPFINKHSVYALADLILRAMRGLPVEVTATREVWRGFVATRELLGVVMAILLANEGQAAIRFDSGGKPMELAEVAASVARRFDTDAARREIIDHPANRYCGNHERWLGLLAVHGLSHIGFEQQLAETADWLSALEGVEI